MGHFRTHRAQEEELIAMEARQPFAPVYAAVVTNKNLRAGYRREPQYLVNWLVSRFNGAYSRYQIVRALEKLEKSGIIESEVDKRGKRLIRLSRRFARR